MTASAAIAATGAQEIQMLLLENVFPSSFNPRKTPDPVGLRELAESIRGHGIQVPLLVRPRLRDGLTDGWEIVAGSRRHAAAEMAGKIQVPCIVREMTDDEAREIALIDNLQREDMPALEEADAYEALRQQLGDAERIAARVGKPVEYVAKRLKLVTLGELQRQTLGLKLIAIDHALLLARMGPEEQDANLKWCLDVNAGVKTTLAAVIADVAKRKGGGDRGAFRGYWEPQSVLNLRHHIEQHAGRALSKAPWDLDDAELVPSAGACNGCPSNTAHNTALFADLSIQKATCEDGKCFETKRERFVQIKLAAATDDAFVAVKLSYKISEAKPGMAKDGSGPNVARVLRYGQWIDVKAKSCPYVRKGVTVDWEDGGWRDNVKGKPGITKLVCIAESCKIHPKAYEKKAASTSSNANDSGDRAKREEAEKQYLETETPIREAIYDALIKSGEVTHGKIFRLLVMSLASNGSVGAKVAGRRNIKVKGHWDNEPIFAAVSQAPITELDGWAFDLLVVPELMPNDYMYSPSDRKRDRKDLWKLARAFGIDPDAIAEGAVRPAIPKPEKVDRPLKAAAKKATPKKAAAKKAAPKKAAKKAPAKKAAKKKAVRK